VRAWQLPHKQICISNVPVLEGGLVSEGAKKLKQENCCKNNYHECVKRTHQICRPVVLISASHLRSSFDHLCAGTGGVCRVAGKRADSVPGF
jgi:hypothetical protein